MKRSNTVPGLQDRDIRTDTSGHNNVRRERRLFRPGFKSGGHNYNDFTSNTTSRRTEHENTATQRHNDRLPAFSLNNRVNGHTGLLDDMEISANHGYLIGSTDEISLFRMYAGASPTVSRPNVSSEMFGKLFNVTPNNGHGRKPLVIRRTPTEWGGLIIPPPPFTGLIHTFLGRTRSGEHGHIIKSFLHLNPSRGINYKPSLTRSHILRWNHVLFIRRGKGELRFGRDGNDNVIPREYKANAKVLGQYRYLKAVYQGIQSELLRASSATDGLPINGLIHSSDFSMRKVEVYWEFHNRDAISLIASLVPYLKSFHRSSREREHAMDIETGCNAPSVTMFISAGVSIRVYAKTSNRIRFEVIFHPKKQSNIIPGGYCAHDFDEFIEKIDHLKDRAADRINDLLSFLSQWHHETPRDRAGTSRFTAEWYKRLDFSETSVHLLELLRTNDRIVSGPSLSTDEYRQIRKALRKGLLFHDKRARAYYPMSIDATPSTRLTDTVLAISRSSSTSNSGLNCQKHSPSNSHRQTRHLHERNGRYYFRIRIPKDLIESGAYGSRKEITQALGTSDRSEAIRLAETAFLQTKRDFKNLRRRQK